MDNNQDEGMRNFFKLMNWAHKRMQASRIEFLPTSDLGNPLDGNHIVIGANGYCGIQKFNNNRPGAILYRMDLETALRLNNGKET